MKIFLLSIPFLLLACASTTTTEAPDPYSWLENVEGQKALSWVDKQNKGTLGALSGSKEFKSIEKTALDLLEDKDKIPYGNITGSYVYNFWRDKKYVRGILRRTTGASYKNKKPRWETVLNIDALAKKEKENWVYKGKQCLPPRYRQCLVYLSRGGKDASVVREFDSKTKKFVKGGFYLKEAKSSVAWMDKDHIFVGTDFGTGTLTESGYPRLVKLWKRGTKLTQAKLIFEGEKKDLAVSGSTSFEHGGATSIITRTLNFYASKAFSFVNGKMTVIPKPDSASIHRVYKGHWLIELRKDWTVAGKKFVAGSLVSMDHRAAFSGKLKAEYLREVFRPSATGSILFSTRSQNRVLINVLENVVGTIYATELKNGKWTKPKKLKLPSQGNIRIASASAYSDQIFYSYEGFLTPESLYQLDLKSGKNEKIKSLKRKFNPKGMVVRQEWATSRDGVKVPYFIVGKKEAISSGNAPTLLYGYGGFEISRTPSYSPTTGRIWLEKGGVYVLANIRGGGEFGPKWHQAALKMNRQKAFDDFIAVAEDLQAKKFTDRDHLAIMGGSNGGLLVGTVMTQRPDLFKGVVCLVPLLDMIRYSQLLAGASWMAEYGDPRKPEMRKYLKSYSPYHNVHGEKKYPNLFLMTSTKDDRVHPGHARKMAAKMIGQGHKNLFYYENTEGGHAASANLKQKAKMSALYYNFLFKTIW